MELKVCSSSLKAHVGLNYPFENINPKSLH